MRHLMGMLAAASMAAVVGLATADEPSADLAKLKADGWVPLFDGKTLSGWKTADNPESWTALPDGTIQGKGERSHLFSPEQYEDCEFRAEIKLNKNGNSGMYFRTEFGPAWPKGYEAQVNNSSRDPQKSGGLYNFARVTKQIVPDDTWWTQHVICKGNHIQIFINGEKVVDFVDEKNTHSKGHLALQQHDPGSVVLYRNVMVKKL